MSEAANAARALEEQGRERSEVVAFFRLPGEAGTTPAGAGTLASARRVAHRHATA
ncbi:hypothetical protein CBM2629_B40286 [Cupriavidus taiwanensis]|nr:hypothetical protein CBM2629_B40286 [Cupriavidus taiwanensis]